MACSTCGATVPDGRHACTTCGAPVASVPDHPRPSELPAPAGAAGCPRCGYSGPGVGYFSKGTHLAFLLFLGVFVLPLGLVYFALRYGHQICPRCAKDWGRDGVPGRGLAPGSRSAFGREGGRPVGAVVLAVLAVMLLVAGVTELELAPALLGLGAGVGSWLLFRKSSREREERRAALLASLTQPVLRLAAARQGCLTVTEVAAELGWTLRRAEKVLNSMDDGLRVRSEVTDEGVIVYEFPELVHPPRRVRGAGSA